MEYANFKIEISRLLLPHHATDEFACIIVNTFLWIQHHFTAKTVLFFSYFPWKYQDKSVFLQLINRMILIMLGINAPKVIAKGEYAQAVRKAALASTRTKAKKVEAKSTSKFPYKFEWVL